MILHEMWGIEVSSIPHMFYIFLFRIVFPIERWYDLGKLVDTTK